MVSKKEEEDNDRLFDPLKGVTHLIYMFVGLYAMFLIVGPSAGRLKS